MLTENESFLLHMFLLSFTTFVGYGIYSYLPAHLTLIVSRSYYYLFGTENVPVDAGTLSPLA